MTRACAHMLYVRSHICLYMLYMFPCTLYIGVAGCQARASGDFAGGSHASSQVRNRIRFPMSTKLNALWGATRVPKFETELGSIIIIMFIYIYIIHPYMDQSPCSRTTLQTLHPQSPESQILGVRVQTPPPDRDVASLFPAGPGGVWSGRCTGRLQWCQVLCTTVCSKV